MKFNKWKVLLPILGLGAVTAVSVPLVVSCSNESTNNSNNGSTNNNGGGNTQVNPTNPNDITLGSINYLYLNKPGEFNEGNKAIMGGNSENALNTPIASTGGKTLYKVDDKNKNLINVVIDNQYQFFSIKLPTKTSELFDPDSLQKINCSGDETITWSYLKGDKSYFSTIDKANNIKSGTLNNNKNLDKKIVLVLKARFQDNEQKEVSKENITFNIQMKA